MTLSNLFAAMRHRARRRRRADLIEHLDATLLRDVAWPEASVGHSRLRRQARAHGGPGFHESAAFSLLL